MNRKESNPQGWEKWMTNNVHWLIILFLASGFSFVWIGIFSLLALVPTAILLARGIQLEARYYAPAPNASKFY